MAKSFSPGWNRPKTEARSRVARFDPSARFLQLRCLRLDSRVQLAPRFLGLLSLLLQAAIGRMFFLKRAEGVSVPNCPPNQPWERAKKREWSELVPAMQHKTMRFQVVDEDEWQARLNQLPRLTNQNLWRSFHHVCYVM